MTSKNQICQKSSFYYYLILIALITTISSIVLRILMTVFNPMLTNHFYLFIKGVLAEVTLSFSLILIALYFNKVFLNKMILILLTINNLIINADTFHFFRYQFRLNNFFLDQQNWLNFIHAERPAFAIIIGVNFILYYFGEKLVSELKDFPSPKFKLLVCAVMILHLTQILPTAIPEKSLNSWNSYHAFHNLATRTASDNSSLIELVNKDFKSIFFEPVDLFVKSPFLHKFHTVFPETAKNKLSRFDLSAKEKIWSHKGFSQSSPPNTPEAAIAAIKNGFKGLEIDIHYSESVKNLVVCHNSLPEEKLKLRQTLPDYLQMIGTETTRLDFLWLDFKNVNLNNLSQSIRNLKTVKSMIPENTMLLIETPDAFISRILVSQGFTTIFAIGYGSKNFQLTDEKAYLYKSLIVLSQCSMISLTYDAWKNINRQKALGQFPVCLYTVNNEKELQSLAEKKHVIGILTELELTISELFP